MALDEANREGHSCVEVYRLALIVLACLTILPAAAFAQASITGVVRDTSGAVLPGVTVEVASPALIEKVRSVVTDDAGQAVVDRDLRPGTYVRHRSRCRASAPSGATASS